MSPPRRLNRAGWTSRRSPRLAGVVEPGRRLRKVVPWIAIVFGILYLIFGVVIQFL